RDPRHMVRPGRAGRRTEPIAHVRTARTGRDPSCRWTQGQGIRDAKTAARRPFSATRKPAGARSARMPAEFGSWRLRPRAAAMDRRAMDTLWRQTTLLGALACVIALLALTPAPAAACNRVAAPGGSDG